MWIDINKKLPSSPGPHLCIKAGYENSITGINKGIELDKKYFEIAKMRINLSY